MPKKGYKQTEEHKRKITEKTRIKGSPYYKHGEARSGKETRLYRVWDSMKQRCFNPRDKAYKWYGGRGIIICLEWKNNYSAFKFWAILNGYQEGLTIDRIDNDGNYEPNNCQFITKEENARKQIHKKGIIFTKEHREKISKALIGRTISKEARRNMSKAKMGKNNPFYGKHHSKETRQRIGKMSKLRKVRRKYEEKKALCKT